VDTVAVAVFGIVFAAILVRQIAGRGPGVWAIFLVGAAGTVVTGVLTPIGAADALDAALPVLLFLLPLFLFAEAFQQSGALEHLARWLIGRTPRPSDLPFVLFVGIGLVAAILVNDAMVLVGVPLLVGVAARLRMDPKPFLLVMTFAVTVGSTLTPFGNPQNLLVAIAGGFPSPMATFLEYLAVPTAINLVVGAWFLRWVYRRSMPPNDEYFRSLQNSPTPFFPSGGWGRRLRVHPVLWAFPGTLLVLVTVDLVAAATHGIAFPSWEIALSGAALMLAATPSRVRVVTGVNWRVLLLFVGLFVVVAGAVVGGVVADLESILPIPGPGHPLAVLSITGTSLVGSQAVSNVPWVGLQIPVLTGLGYSATTPIAWMTLAGASTLAGNLTFVGAASNLITVEAAEQLGVRIRLGEFMRVGVPLTAITVAVLVGCLWLGV
jgi:Na+/H+ antiporter NhaD/arsenite permease-like protein